MFIKFKSRLLSSVRPFMAVDGDDDDQNNNNDDGNNSGGAGGAQDQGGANDTDDQNSGGDQGAGDDAGDGDQNSGGDQGGAAAAAAQQAQDWKDRELARKHRQIQEAKRKEAELEAELETMRAVVGSRTNADGGQQNGGGQQNNTNQNGGAATFTKEDVAVEAQKIVSQQQFNEAANTADKKGREVFKDSWDKACDNLKTLGGFKPEELTQILATDNPHQVLHALGSNPDEYHRIMELPAAKRQTELVKLGLTPAKEVKRPSGAPAPQGGTNQRRGTNVDENTKIYSDKIDDDEWYAIRARQKEQRFAQRQGNKTAARG